MTYPALKLGRLALLIAIAPALAACPPEDEPASSVLPPVIPSATSDAGPDTGPVPPTPDAAPIPTAVAAKKVAAGSEFTCALLATGAVKCWGSNASGELGDGTGGAPAQISAVPVGVKGLDHGVVDLSAGPKNACVVTDTGGVRCWGEHYGNAPVDVAATGIVSISVGGILACALDQAGEVLCWDIGKGAALPSVPAVVTGAGPQAKAISVGSSHACAIAANKTVRCWGTNASGQLGNDDTKTNPVPEAVVGLTDPAAALASGWNHTCVITAAGGLDCWGDALPLPNHPAFQHAPPPKFAPPADCGYAPSDAVAVTASFDHTCLSTKGGEVKCWGVGHWGELGNGSQASLGAPSQAAVGLTGAVGVATGEQHTCAVTGTGSVLCWGMNSKGEVGNGTTALQTSPSVVQGL
jgi:alpha-tubulin suppressor-like RCC1 family protein